MWDALRKKEVSDTPEERVRQWFIGVLQSDAAVPPSLMMSEVLLKRAVSPGSGTPCQWRADIVIYDRKAKPLAVVECKRPEVPLGREVLEQALRYSGALGVRYFFMTNGHHTRICRWDRDRHEFLDHVPTYDEMTMENDDKD